MKLFFNIFIFLFTVIHSYAQDTSVIITSSMFTVNDEILIAPLDGWIFKEGNQMEWANEKIDVTGWQKLKPAQLPNLNINKNGIVEGWFRIKIKPDNSFANTPLGFKYTGWAATELYIDGKLIEKFGNTGTNGELFKEYIPVHRYSIPLNLEPGKEHLLAIHFVDYISPFPLPKKIKSISFPLPQKHKSNEFSNSLFSITGPNYNSDFEHRQFLLLVFKTSNAAICFVMTLLFWLISYQNSKEINLRLITIFSILGAIYSSLRLFWLSQSCSYDTYIVTQFLNNVLITTIFGFIPLIIAQGLNQKINFYLKLFLGATILTGIFCGIYINYFFTLPILATSIISMILSSYLIFRSWKSIRGAQWAIVSGFFIFIFSCVVLLLLVSKISFRSYLFFDSLPFISLPLAYVVYVSMRFREVINEVNKNALQLILISAEKKELVDRQNEMLEQQVVVRTSELNQSLLNLKATQSQLIQSEKMASLGELTAGIAHEIQNPLNFVNNFSEVSAELVDEMNEEIKKGNLKEAKEIASDLKQNLEKINHHGKRADAIVKGMLQHSRSSSATKEPTDINKLADEYLRLAYHGLRAKDKSFNATMKTDFDETIGNINIIPQDIGRVILNLITNAFYVVNEKALSAVATPTAAKYEPTVSVSTKKKGDKVLISVKDNGNGISQKVLDKIFQPFFTTKPTGKGTGLGLSLSYDIVKAHGGEIKVNTKEYEGTEFTIILPA